MVNRKKGFTLVEVIVVLIVLSILAAILVPALTGWIDEARAKACLSAMGQIARDYHACVAETGYGALEPIQPQKCLQRAVSDILAKNASGNGYVCPGGGTCTVTYGANSLISSITCSLHGTMHFADTGIATISIKDVGDSIKQAAAAQSVNLNASAYSNVPGPRRDAILNLLGDSSKEFLKNRIWKINAGVLFIYDGGSLDQFKTGATVPIHVYDLKNGKDLGSKTGYVATVSANNTSVKTLSDIYS